MEGVHQDCSIMFSHILCFWWVIWIIVHHDRWGSASMDNVILDTFTVWDFWAFFKLKNLSKICMCLDSSSFFFKLCIPYSFTYMGYILMSFPPPADLTYTRPGKRPLAASIKGQGVLQETLTYRLDKCNKLRPSVICGWVSRQCDWEYIYLM